MLTLITLTLSLTLTLTQTAGEAQLEVKFGGVMGVVSRLKAQQTTTMLEVLRHRPERTPRMCDGLSPFPL